ncbi:transketolase [Domibacillus sp. DTU_2020_1001157_1_SI_ALB_TIR_016]|uniref:transketolase n=1 Tax=Domibacillus sp. DTU_2020_1001157_1_SI_ALB_TIR_016 TaxID=3077789 RepID=UPI0028E4247A|nr:transketolase [Domibacillus sp. DTU_2020_1001157_1_SI_ALB_TIR_016]WNS78654.1 transketolase [Domibacillus sp. DTU_2020_1001157_1_SI_ALB_TIR_016]
MSTVSVSNSVEQLAINAIRTLSIDAVEKAKSGHPGMPMGAAPMAYTLWSKVMNHNPANPEWFNRDRFVLSAGHGSMLLYSLLHLCGYDVSLEDLKQFRQWGSKTPGHPEYGHTPGVDATTGPLGQGVAMGVGMAMAEAHLAAKYNKDQFAIVDHYTYVICGDGDLMEGVSAEAASLAGHLKLGKLVMMYDSNNITLDGEANLSFSEDVGKRFESYGWQVLKVSNQHDIQNIEQALLEAKKETAKPTLIEVITTLGYGSPNKGGKGGHQGTHGSPLGKEEAALTKEFYQWPQEDFFVPEEVRAHYEEIKAKGIEANQQWEVLLAQYKQAFPELAQSLEQDLQNAPLYVQDETLPTYEVGAEISTRIASGQVLNALAQQIPSLLGGSADLESSTMTHLNGLDRFAPGQYEGRNVYFGVREFAMGAVLNGLALHGGVKPFGSTFFVFSDYLRPAIRLAALMNLPVTYVFTHDSIFVGEDGPTHEPIEQLAALRSIPNVTVLRPADANETVAAWKYAAENQNGPVALVLSRQNIKVTVERETALNQLVKGAYVLAGTEQVEYDVQLMATGSEVSLAVQVREQLVQEGIRARVISMPSWELFEKQTAEYQDSILGTDNILNVAIELASPFGWANYVGRKGLIVGIPTFGASAPGAQIAKEFGFTVESIVSQIKKRLS